MPSLLTALSIASGVFTSLLAHAAPSVHPYEADLYTHSHTAPALLTPIDDVDDNSLISRASTCNTPTNRACWTNGFDINTDYEASTPTTGVTRTFTWTVEEKENWVGPDGVVKRVAMLVNGQFPGPTLTADWGDKISVTIKNNLKYNGTSIHWHGIRQLNSNLHDGANGVTECPIRPGASKTYNFLATQYGSSWYHSHFSAQYGNGVVGPIVINGPASLPYEIDLGAFPITDYYYRTADELVEVTKNAGAPPSDNVLFNGTNINPRNPAQGKYANVTLTPGKRHRLRIINTSVENNFIVSLANHQMTIIESDFVPVNSQTVDSLFMGVGQRYDVTIDASKAVDNYWFNVTFVPGTSQAPFPCGTSNNPAPAAIFHYAGASGNRPTNPGTVIGAPTTCTDLSNLTPVVRRTVNPSGFQKNESDTLDVTLDIQPGTGQLFTWKINGSAIDVDWNKPVDEYVLTNQEAALPRSENIVRVDQKDAWTFWLIENDPVIPLPHPIHLHGHDFVVVGRSDPNASGLQTFNPATARLNGSNPTRRDVTMLPSQGWVVIGFKTDNPGAWLLHCHIAWHVSGGFSVDFLERPNDFKTSVNPVDVAAFNANCNNWRAYYPALDPYKKQDSGLKMKFREVKL